MESSTERRRNGPGRRARVLAVALTVLAVLAVAVRFAPPVGALPDTEPPVLHGGSVTPGSVAGDAPTTAARTLTFTASLSDNTTGLSYANANFRSPSGNHYLYVSFQVFGGTGIINPIDVQGTLVVPRYSETGTWQLNNLYLGDVATNQAGLDSTAVAATGFPTQFDVTGVADTTAPQLVASAGTLVPSTVDDLAPDAAARTISVSAGVTDDFSGVQQVYVNYHLGNQYAGTALSLSAGDGLSGTWSGSFVVALHAATGTWTLSNLYLIDVTGNSVSLDPPTAGALGFPTQFDVTGTQDVTPPDITAFSLTPTSFNNVGCSTTVDLTAHVTDDVAGATYASMSFVGPANQQHGVSLSRSSGTETDGEWTGSFSLPFESAVGTWKLQSAYTGDAAGNGRGYSPADFAAAGFPTAFDVVAGTGQVCLRPDVSVQEGSGSATVMASLTTQPAADISLDLSQTPGAGAAAVTQLSFSPAQITFTPADWNVAQPVSVSALDDGTTEANPHHATLQGTATSSDPDFDGQQPKADVTIGEQSPQLQVTAVPSSAHGLSGFGTDWTFVLSNTGAGIASSPQLTVIVPTGTPGHTITSPGTMDAGFSCVPVVATSSTDYTCTRAAALQPNEQAHFAVSTTMGGSSGESADIVATGSADATPATPASTATVTATVDTPVFDLAVSDAPDASAVLPGGAVQWTSTVINQSTDGETATGLQLDFALSAGLSLSGPPTMPGYVCAPSAGAGPVTISCSGGPPLPPAPGTNAVSLTVPTTVTAAGGQTVGTATHVHADQTDADPKNDDASASTDVVADKGADLEVQKSVSSKTVEPGKSVTWTVTTTNPSKTTSADAPTIDDVLPAGLSPTNVSAPPGFVCTSDSTSVHCSAPALAPGASAVLTFDTVVNGAAGTKYLNTATVKSGNDANPDNNGASAGVRIDGAVITGQVTEEGTGNPLGGIQVRVYAAGDLSDGVADVSTAADGTYSVDGLGTGSYLVWFRDGSGGHAPQWFDHAVALAGATAVVISDPGALVKGVDATLGEPTTISGTVTAEVGGAPLADICVGAYDPDVPDFNHQPVAETTTDKNGEYTIQGLASTPYLVLFRDCSKQPTYALEFYDGGTGTADPTKALPVTPEGRGVGKIDAALGTGGTISGIIWDVPSNSPLVGFCALVYEPEFGAIGFARADSQGHYQLKAVPAGAWYVAAGECDAKDGGEKGFVWYAGSSSVKVTVVSDQADPEGDGAKRVTVVAGADTPDINLYFGGTNGGGQSPGSDPAPTDPGDAGADGVTGTLPFTGMPGPSLAIAGLVLLVLGVAATRVARPTREQP